MAENSDLKKLKKNLNGFYCYFKDDNMLTISEDKSVLPFAHIIVDNNYPDLFLISVAVDYPHSEKAVEVALWANTIRITALTEPFFISATGVTHMGEDAHYYHDMEVELPITDIEPTNKNSH